MWIRSSLLSSKHFCIIRGWVYWRLLRLTEPEEHDTFRQRTSRDVSGWLFHDPLFKYNSGISLEFRKFLKTFFWNHVDEFFKSLDGLCCAMLRITDQRLTSWHPSVMLFDFFHLYLMLSCSTEVTYNFLIICSCSTMKGVRCPLLRNINKKLFIDKVESYFVFLG